MEYPKIDSVFMRDPKGRFTDELACAEFTYLIDNDWTWTEKVDGTNVRLYFPGLQSEYFRGHEYEYVKGRTDSAQLNPKLLNACVALLQTMPLDTVFPDPTTSAVLYGEGYGAGIQKGGMYRPDPSFVLFDVKVGDWWLRRPAVEDVAAKLGLDVVPIVDTCVLSDAIETMRTCAVGEWFTSAWPDATPEGVVGRPVVDLWNRKGERIVTKLKFKDFR